MRKKGGKYEVEREIWGGGDLPEVQGWSPNKVLALYIYINKILGIYISVLGLSQKLQKKIPVALKNYTQPPCSKIKKLQISPNLHLNSIKFPLKIKVDMHSYSGFYFAFERKNGFTE